MRNISYHRVGADYPSAPLKYVSDKNPDRNKWPKSYFVVTRTTNIRYIMNSCKINASIK